jgi:hypothetical protein
LEAGAPTGADWDPIKLSFCGLISIAYAESAEGFRSDADSHDSQKAPLGALTLKSEPGPPMKLGNAAGAGVRLIIRCRDCNYQVEPDPAAITVRHVPKRLRSIGTGG